MEDEHRAARELKERRAVTKVSQRPQQYLYLQRIQRLLQHPRQQELLRDQQCILLSLFDRCTHHQGRLRYQWLKSRPRQQH
jgi:hypothetical protein